MPKTIGNKRKFSALFGSILKSITDFRLILLDHITYVQKDLLIRTLIKQLTNYQIFTKLPKISHIHKNRSILKHNWRLIDQLLLPYNFLAGACKESTFSFLPVASR